MEQKPTTQTLRDLWFIRFGRRHILFADVLGASRDGCDWHSILRDLALAGALKRREVRKGVRVTYQLKE